jgi:uncharacterized membrane protein YphA (DoxX/SURF4 family)
MRPALFPLGRQAMEKGMMIKDFNVAEKGHGSYWLLGILRWVMVLIFISFGIQKFTPQSADGIALYISNSPLVSWLSIFGIRGEAYLLGTIELTTAAILASIRYQLLQRTLCAAIAANQLGQSQAWMVVQSFSTGSDEGYIRNRSDFDRYVALVGSAPVVEGVRVRIAWADDHN